jgi:hypothetical protein
MPIRLAGQFPDPRDGKTMLLVSAMGHVQAKYVDPGVNQFPDFAFRTAGGAQGGNNFGAPPVQDGPGWCWIFTHFLYLLNDGAIAARTGIKPVTGFILK